jgi:hypothetical protein
VLQLFFSFVEILVLQLLNSSLNSASVNSELWTVADRREFVAWLLEIYAVYASNWNYIQLDPYYLLQIWTESKSSGVLPRQDPGIFVIFG